MLYGSLQIWDTSTGHAFIKYKEHQRRAWSVDFSPIDPSKFASGGDDCSVRIWSINEVSKTTHFNDDDKYLNGNT